MKYRVQEFKSVQKGRTYTYTWLGYSYRNEKGTPTFKCLYNLSTLPEGVIHNIKYALSFDGQVSNPVDHVEFINAVPIGAEAVAFHFAEELGIVNALDCLPELYKKLVLSLILDRIVEAFPHSRKSLFENLPGSGLSRVCDLDVKNSSWNGCIMLLTIYIRSKNTH